MNQRKKIASLVLMLPMLAIMMHFFIPHHHHEYCVTEHQEQKSCCPGAVVQSFEENNHEHQHNHESSHHECNKLNSHKSASHDVDCHVQLIYKVEKIKIDHSLGSYIVLIKPLTESLDISYDLYEIVSDAPNIDQYYLRGPPPIV